MNPIYEVWVLGYDIFKERGDIEPEYLGFVPDYNKRSVRSACEQLVLSTHMGELRHSAETGHLCEYATTIGVYFKLKRVRRRIETVSAEWSK